MGANIAETFEHVAGLDGQKTSLIEAGSGKQMSFAEMRARVNGYANFLAAQGIRSSERVILMVTPSADFICLTFALFKTGATIILIDPGMGYKNLLRCIEGVVPTALIGIPKALLFSKIFPGPFRSVTKRLCCGSSFGLFGRDIRLMATGDISTFPAYQPGVDDLAAIIFTTGSTGPPKGVRYEHTIFAAQLARIRDHYKIDSSHTDQPAFPLFALFSTALGACAIIPDMDPTRPAKVDPKKFIDSILKYGVSYSFGSPAIWNVVSDYCISNSIVLESLKKVLMAGAPVPGDLLERVSRILPEEAEIFTPYGATESLPIVSMEGKEILSDTWSLTQQGKGTCVGRPLSGIDLKIITITDGPIDKYSEDLLLTEGTIGEIIVRGDVVTRAYENNDKENALGKIKDSKSFWHRMGDTGYLDKKGRLWFCGRKAHRVITKKGTLYTIPCEAIINEHPDVYRSALVGIERAERDGYAEPVLVVEPRKTYRGSEKELLREVTSLAADSPITADIHHFLIHPDFPVDIRHNAKIFREKLAIWAAGKVRRDK